MKQFVFKCSLWFFLLHLLSAILAVPVVLRVTPNNGPQSGNIPVHLFGENLGTDVNDILDVVVGGGSCKSSIAYYNSSYIVCTLPPQGQGIPQNNEVYVITTSQGSGQFNPNNALFHYNSPPSVIAVFPSSGPVTGMSLVQLQGDNLGLSQDDLVEILVAGQPCIYSLRWFSSKNVSCITSQAPGPISGPVIITTKSGGSSTISLPYTYVPVCYLHTDESSCKKNECYWCSLSSSCLGDNDSCPVDCTSGNSRFSCANLLLLLLMACIFVSMIVFVTIVVKQIKGNPQFKSKLRRLSKSSSKSKDQKKTYGSFS